MSVYDKYELVIGLECHIQLLTRTKMYSSDPAEYGALPNSNVSVITLGHPGTLPKVNKRAIEFAVRLGIATKSTITVENQFARKNYFYADLPKGYQITQDKTPICTGGVVAFKLKDGTEKQINLIRIHMEEDAGKSMHDIDPFETLIDLNRAGTPLCEIVTQPDFRSGEEAYAYLNEVRKLVRYLDVCDGNMEEGSLRCDANISVRIKGAKEYGRRTEVKNMNSFRNVQRAIDFEIKRQIDLIENGETVAMETRSFDAVNGTTFAMRSKESANDYRYFPEPDLQPVMVTKEYIEKVRSELPPLPSELHSKYVKEYGLSEYDANVLTEEKEIALYYNELVSLTKNYKAAANWVMGPVKSYLNENALHIKDFPLAPRVIEEIIRLIDENSISYSNAAQKLFPAMLVDKDKLTAKSLAEKLDLIKSNDLGELEQLINQAIAKYPEKVTEYRNGKTGVLGLFLGEVKKMSGGKADLKIATDLVKQKLEK